MSRTPDQEPRGFLPTRSRRWFLETTALALAGVACKPAQAAGYRRVFLPSAANDNKPPIGGSGNETPIPTPDRTPTSTVTTSPTPTRTPTETPIPPKPTPEPTATPDTRPSSPWPTEIEEELRLLPVLNRDRLRFGYYTDYNQIPYDDIKAIFTPEGGANADVPRSMVHLLTHQELTNMWVILTLGHEVFHHHEAWISVKNNPGLTIPFNYQKEYLSSPEGKDYVTASDAVVNEAHRLGMTDLSYLTPWEMPNFGVNTYEEAAGMGSIWYQQRSWLDRDILAPIKNWAIKWLPTSP